jgi:signal transduction histidine kinase
MPDEPLISSPWPAAAWLAIGLLAGASATMAAAWRLLRSRERRARVAERRAAGSQRLAELGSMTGGLAHEIKNPLSTLVLNAQMLEEEIDGAVPDAETRERLRRRVGALSREAMRLRDILTDFLRYAGRMRLDPQRRDVAEIAADLADFFHPQCEQAAVLMRVEAAGGPLPAEVDEGLFKQALLNLMLNAVQAMDPGRPREGAAPRGELIIRAEGDAEEVRIHVIDTGPGIPIERQEEIFRPYFSGKSGGSGLGLPTARRIVEEHGGRLSLHSEPGRGSDFTIHLPRSAGVVPPPDAAA